MQTKQPLLKITGMNKVFDNIVAALKNVDLTVYPGDVLGLIGENGSGKLHSLDNHNEFRKGFKAGAQIVSAAVYGNAPVFMTPSLDSQSCIRIFEGAQGIYLFISPASAFQA